MKIDRQKVYERFNGHCAYCGKEIEFKQMQVDHFWPQFLAHLQPDLDNNRPGNLMPSCRKCNNFKGGLRPEDFRKELSKQVERLRKNSQFDRALRFGQIETAESPIVFYFEKEIPQGREAASQNDNGR
jgi:hypothetical protein